MKNTLCTLLAGALLLSGTYAVAQTDNDCSDHYDLKFPYSDVLRDGRNSSEHQGSAAGDVTTAQDDMPVNNDIDFWQIGPNPSNGQFTIDFPVNEVNTNIEVYDLSGKLVHREQALDYFQHTIILPEHLEGAFILGLVPKGKVQSILDIHTFRIIVER